MSRSVDNIVKSRKVGMEHVIMMRLPADRFQNSFPPQYNAMIDEKSRYQVLLLAQSCTNNSFDNEEVGQTDDAHLWLQIASSKADSKLIGADFMLPSMQWFGLVSATSNAGASNHLQSFGFNPLNLAKNDLQEKCGLITFSDGGIISWSITGPGRKYNRVGVNHEIFVAKKESHSNGHCISALVSNIEMELLGRVYIQTTALEPFLFENEKLPAAVHLMNRLEANITYKKLPNNSGI